MSSLINEEIYNDYHGFGIVTKEFDEYIEVAYPDGFYELLETEQIRRMYDLY